MRTEYTLHVDLDDDALGIGLRLAISLGVAPFGLRNAVAIAVNSRGAFQRQPPRTVDVGHGGIATALGIAHLLAALTSDHPSKSTVGVVREPDSNDVRGAVGSKRRE